MLEARWCKYRLNFSFTARTSRETMTWKDTYFVKVYDSERPAVFGIGECALFKGLSADDTPEFESALAAACANPNAPLPEMSTIRFGFETAMADLATGGRRLMTANDWTRGDKGITINGLIWMADKQTMLRRVADKIAKGFKTIKIKIGGIDFDDECDILRSIREQYKAADIKLRLDANGSFNAQNALPRLEKLSQFDIHSIEQPIAAGQAKLMREICEQSPIAIALDEELIGFRNNEQQFELLSQIHPQYIILKPSLCGGFERADQWIEAANELGIGWWATSALESDIGLNAIAQWVSAKNPTMAQGLGTGELFTNNIGSPLHLRGDMLFNNPERPWAFPELPWQQ